MASTTESGAEAADLYTRHINDEALRAKIERTRQPSNDNGLRTEGDPDSGSEEPLPRNLAEKIAEHPREVASFYPLQEWDGYVLEVCASSFRARLIDITNEDAAVEEEVEIPLDELDEDSQTQLAEGRLFRWSIGYQRSRTGQKTRFSKIIVRRLPAWRPEDIEAAKCEAKELSRKLEWK